MTEAKTYPSGVVVKNCHLDEEITENEHPVPSDDGLWVTVNTKPKNSYKHFRDEPLTH